MSHKNIEQKAEVARRLNESTDNVIRTQVSLADYHNPFAGTPFRAPPPHLRYLYRIVDEDYGVSDNGAVFTLPIPGRPGKFFFTSIDWFEKREHPYYRIVYGAPTYFRRNAGPATSPDLPGVKLFWKLNVNVTEVMMVFIASVTRIGPALYDFFLTRMITEQIVTKPEPRDFVDDFLEIAARAQYVYSIEHRDLGSGKNALWDGERYYLIDWAEGRFLPRKGAAPWPPSLLGTEFEEFCFQPGKRQSPYVDPSLRSLTEHLSDDETKESAEEVMDSSDPTRARSGVHTGDPSFRKTAPSRKYRLLQKLWRREGYNNQESRRYIPPPPPPLPPAKDQ